MTDAKPPATGADEKATLRGFLDYLRTAVADEDVADWRATLRPSTEDTIDGVLTRYREAVEHANRVIDACSDLAQPAQPRGRRGRAPSMRWVLVHMIEETGRHAGHADILREQIDGSTGR